MSKDHFTNQSILAVENTLRQLRCTAHLNTNALQAMAAVGVKREFQKNQALWNVGEPGEFLVIICQGFIEITRYSNRDEEICMGIFGPTDVVGISAIMGKTRYPGSAKCLVNKSEVIKLYLRPLLQSSNQAVANDIHNWIRENLLLHEQVLFDKIHTLNAGSVEHRILELLKQFVRRFGHKDKAGNVTIPIALTRTQVAKLTDVRVETIIRSVSRWKKDGLIDWGNEQIVIPNLAQLEKSLSVD